MSYFWYVTQTPLPTSSNNLCAAELTRRCTTSSYNIDSQQTSYRWEKIGYRVGCNYLPYAILQRYYTLRSAISKLYNLYYRSVRRRVASTASNKNCVLLGVNVNQVSYITCFTVSRTLAEAELSLTSRTQVSNRFYKTILTLQSSRQYTPTRGQSNWTKCNTGGPFLVRSHPRGRKICNIA